MWQIPIIDGAKDRRAKDRRAKDRGANDLDPTYTHAFISPNSITAFLLRVIYAPNKPRSRVIIDQLCYKKEQHCDRTKWPYNDDVSHPGLDRLSAKSYEDQTSMKVKQIPLKCSNLLHFEHKNGLSGERKTPLIYISKLYLRQQVIHHNNASIIGC